MEEDNKQDMHKSEAFSNEQKGKGLDKLKDLNRKSKSKMGKIKKIIAVIKTVLLSLKILLPVIIVGVLLAGFVEIVKVDNADQANKAKASAVVSSSSSSENVSTYETDEDGNITYTRIVVGPNESGDSYEIGYCNLPENIERIRGILAGQGVESVSKLSDYEIAVIGSFIDNGSDFGNYSIEMLKCLPVFLRAEFCTQFLDLRPNSEKLVNGDYVPQNIEELAENQVPGNILLKRTNTNGDVTILEYIKKVDFDRLIQQEDQSVRNYFTLDDQGNLMYAEWDYIKVDVSGEYPDIISEEEKISAQERYIPRAVSIDYKQYIDGYNMPFEFLIDILSLIEEPEFCMELVGYAMGSEIVLNIQEEETETVTTQERTYDAHLKTNKTINYEVTPQIEIGTDHLIEKMIDDEKPNGNACTIYENKQGEVTITTTRKEHSYIIETIEVDTWLMKRTTKYGDGTTIENTFEDNPKDSINTYEKTSDSGQVIIDQDIINTDSDVASFKTQKEAEYAKQILIPNVTITNNTDNSGEKYKKINVTNGYTNIKTDYKEIKDQNGKGTGKYGLPQNLIVITQANSATETTQAIPAREYYFTINSDETVYTMQTDITTLGKCNVTSLKIEKYQKVNLINQHLTEKTTQYKADQSPQINTEYYTADENGNYQKFLAAYDNSSVAQNRLEESWLYEMMDKNDATKELINDMKYLFSVYDGVDRGVTKEELTEEEIKRLTEQQSKNNFSNMGSAKYWWPIGSLNVSDTINGIDIYGEEPASVNVTSEFGYRGDIGVEGATADHAAIDIGAVTGTPVIAVADGEVIIASEGYNGGRGNYIRIDHGNGVVTLYQHLHTIDVKVGDSVIQGQKIGTVGNTGISGGSHLHFELIVNGQNVDPLNYVSKTNTRPQKGQLLDFLHKSSTPQYDPTGTKYKMYDDGGGIPTVGKGDVNYVSNRTSFPEHVRKEIDAKLCSTDGTNKSGKQISELNIYVDISVVDDVAYSILSSKINFIENSTKELDLKQYQKDALIAATYHYGQGGVEINGFIEAYKKYGEKIGLWNTWWYKNGFNYYGSAAKGVFPGWLAVNESRYELFTTGNYDAPMYGREYKYYTSSQIKEMGF